MYGPNGEIVKMKSPDRTMRIKVKGDKVTVKGARDRRAVADGPPPGRDRRGRGAARGGRAAAGGPGGPGPRRHPAGGTVTEQGTVQ